MVKLFYLYIVFIKFFFVNIIQGSFKYEIFLKYQVMNELNIKIMKEYFYLNIKY